MHLREPASLHAGQRQVTHPLLLVRVGQREAELDGRLDLLVQLLDDLHCLLAESTVDQGGRVDVRAPQITLGPVLANGCRSQRFRQRIAEDLRRTLGRSAAGSQHGLLAPVALDAVVQRLGDPVAAGTAVRGSTCLGCALVLGVLLRAGVLGPSGTLLLHAHRALPLDRVYIRIGI